MNINQVIFDECTFGITRRSLKMLRDILVESFGHKIAIIEVPTSDICCGYMIIDADYQKASFTGEGFRMDNGGEGGAGYRSAEVLFDLFGIRPLTTWNPVDFNPIYQDMAKAKDLLLKLAQEIAEQLTDEDFKAIKNLEPAYVRS